MHIASRLNDVLIALYLALVRLYQGHHVGFFASFLSIGQKKHQQTKKNSATKIMSKPQHLIYESLKELRLFNLKAPKKWFSSNIPESTGSREDEVKPFCEMQWKKER